MTPNITPENPYKDELHRFAVAKIMQFATYESSEPNIERIGTVECVGIEDGIVELAFDLRQGRQRTYVRIPRADLLRIIKEN